MWIPDIGVSLARNLGNDGREPVMDARCLSAAVPRRGDDGDIAVEMNEILRLALLAQDDSEGLAPLSGGSASFL